MKDRFSDPGVLATGAAGRGAGQMIPYLVCQHEDDWHCVHDHNLYPKDRLLLDGIYPDSVFDTVRQQTGRKSALIVSDSDDKDALYGAERTAAELSADFDVVRVWGFPGGLAGFLQRGGTAPELKGLVAQKLAEPEWPTETERECALQYADAWVKDRDVQGAARVADLPRDVCPRTFWNLARVQKLIRQASERFTMRERLAYHERQRVFAEHYVRHGNGPQAAAYAGLQNPDFLPDEWPEHLLALPFVQNFIEQERALLAEKELCSEPAAQPEPLDAEMPTQANEAADQLPEGLNVVSVGSLAGLVPPERPWIVEHWLPSRAVTLFAGNGGTGKSLAVQQWLSCLSVGVSFMGVRGVVPVRCAYLNCEDDLGELHRRQVSIAKAIDRRLQTFGDDMQLVARLGAPDNTLGTFDHATGRFVPSAFFEAIRAYCVKHKIRVVALDNVAHLFGSNENIRGEVTAFLNLLSRLALEIDGAVILVGHPAKADGSQYSGSTAWENGVRNRLHLRRPAADEGCLNENSRILSREKSNLASIGDQISMVWHDGAFHPPSAVEAASGREALDETAFLACLDAATSQGRNVSHATGSNHAPTVFSKMPQSNGIGKRRLAAAMERLLNDGTVLANQPLWRSAKGRRQVFGLARADREAGQ